MLTWAHEQFLVLYWTYALRYLLISYHSVFKAAFISIYKRVTLNLTVIVLFWFQVVYLEQLYIMQMMAQQSIPKENSCHSSPWREKTRTTEKISKYPTHENHIRYPNQFTLRSSPLPSFVFEWIEIEMQQLTKIQICRYLTIKGSFAYLPNQHVCSTVRNIQETTDKIASSNKIR